MDKWRHLFFEGEYAAPEKILSGLTFKQITYLPAKESHSIYEELWHLTQWQHIVVFRNEQMYETWAQGDLYPTRPPTSTQDWHDLVTKFFRGLEEVMRWTNSPEGMKIESEPGITMEDTLISLAVHNAYHLGKIVAVRQMLRAWSFEVP